MIRMLSDNSESVDAVKASVGKQIKAACIRDEENLVLEFEDGTRLTITDDGQSCCENRFMTSDDDFADIIGAELIDFELLDGPEVDDNKYDIEEVQFLHVKTSKGTVTIENHNQHNGYYGGFALTASLR